MAARAGGRWLWACSGACSCGNGAVQRRCCWLVLHPRCWLAFTNPPPDRPCAPGRAPERGLVQHLALAYWCFHYVKRELETALVHK